MASITNKQIESAAVQAIETAAIPHPLTPNIPIGDKGISFDGDIEVMKSQSEKKADFLGKVPVQVKGKKVNGFSGKTRKFSLELADLKNFYLINGAILFVVEVTTNFETKIFFKPLLPYELKMLIKKYSNQKKRTIVLREMDSNSMHIICKNFLVEANKQPVNLIENNPFKKDQFTKFTISSLTFNPEVDNSIIDHEFNVYGYVGDFAVPIGIGTIGEECYESNDTPVIDGSEYPKVAVEYRTNRNIVTLILEDSVEIKIEKNGKFRFTILKFKSVEIQLRVLPILIALLSGSKIIFKESGATLLGGKPDDEAVLKRIEEIYQDYKNLGNAFSILKVENYVEFSDENSELQNNIKLFADIVVNKDLSKINLDKFDSSFCQFNIGGLKFLFYRLKPNNQIINAFSEEMLTLDTSIVITDHNGKIKGKYPMSPYVKMETKELLEFTNINFTTIKSSFEIHQQVFDDDTFTFINFFCINCIEAYDISNNIEFLELADYLYLLNKSRLSEASERIRKINQSQISIRKNKCLSPGEARELMTIKQQNAENVELVFCISVLLGSTTEASLSFDRIPNEYQEKIKEYPIYKLYEKQIVASQ